MIRTPTRTLPPELEGMLAALQAKIDVRASYEERVEAAARSWKSRSRERFQPIRAVLGEMCPGAGRCVYCEDSAADEIEHLRPKSLYPEVTFVWDNYLFACGPCNGPKNDRIGVLSRQSRAFVEVARRRGAPVVPPEPGRMMLIDPRREDPLRFMELDLVFPFHFDPIASRGCVARARAAYTIEVLGLNRRDVLLRARAGAYRGYVARLKEYISERDGSAEPARLERLVNALRSESHPTVWREMQRQHRTAEEIRPPFERVPEALGWLPLSSPG